MKANYITPQIGFQTQFVSTPADIAIGGGAAGAGKTFVLLLEALRFTGLEDFGAVIFRRTTPMITNKGGLWDESSKIYLTLPQSPEPVAGKHLYRFPSGATIQFRHMEHEKNRFDWQGSQIPMIGFDELTHFSEDQFFYMLSRNRSTCGIKPYIRATTNPQSQGWVKEFVSWWIYPDNYEIETLQGYPIPERAGVLRYMLRDDEEIVWGNSKAEVIEKCPHIFTEEYVETLKGSGINPSDTIKSVTFIPGSVHENNQLLSKDPAYLGNLMALSTEEKAKLLGGCWKQMDNANQLYEYGALVDLANNSFVKASSRRTDRYVTADIALEGSDKFVIGVWHGWVLKKVYEYEKSDGPDVIRILEEIAKRHQVPQKNIIFDYDGVGNFVSGFLKNAYAFKHRTRPFNNENYADLSAQCFYKLAEKINNHEVYVEDPDAVDKIVRELNCVKKIPTDGFSKLDVILKAQMKNILGYSPDYADMMKMRMAPELKGKRKGKTESAVI